MKYGENASFVLFKFRGNFVICLQKYRMKILIMHQTGSENICYGVVTMNHEELYFLLAKKNRATAENHVCVVRFAEEKKGVKTTS